MSEIPSQCILEIFLLIDIPPLIYVVSQLIEICGEILSEISQQVLIDYLISDVSIY